VAADVGSDVLNAQERLCIRLGNPEVKSVFQGHDQLHAMERIGAKILDKPGVEANPARVEIEDFPQHGPDAVLDSILWHIVA
jgi:hypothetical protein